MKISATPASPLFRRPRLPGLCLCAAVCLVLGLGGAGAYGGKGASGAEEKREGPGEALPAALVDVGIEEHLGARVPLDIAFLDDAGRKVELSRYFQSGKPVLFSFAYYQCPMLCNMVLNGMLGGMKKLSWVPGKEFEVITLSIDHREGPELAAAKKATHIEQLGKPEAAAGWHFLTGKEADIKRVADAIGFTYHYNPASNDYAHAAGIFTLSPQGKISRYLYGVDFRSKDLRLALLDASEGKALSFGDQIIMFCYRYDANAKSYVLFARNFMRGGGYVVVGFLTLLLVGLWRREFKKKKADEPITVGTGA
jgi:protein SCO1